MPKAVLTCTHHLCFEHIQEKCQTFSSDQDAYPGFSLATSATTEKSKAPMQYAAIGYKQIKFSDKNVILCCIFAPIIDVGYSLEPPHLGCSNEYQLSKFRAKKKK